MRSRRPIRPTERRGALPAALALLALITQLLIPAASLAHEVGEATRTVVLCTIEGTQTVSVPTGESRDHGFGGLKCHDCVMASVAAIAAGDGTVVPVRYAVENHLEPTGQTRLQTHARAPPRPPSTAPPAFRTA